MTAIAWKQEWLRGSSRHMDEPRVWRGVETQHMSATMLLVDTGDEHDLLENMLEASKPPLPSTRQAQKHYLLVTPFRYTPRHPSRFRPAGHRGLWYGALQLRAACAEVAYWRMVFILDSVGLRGKKIVNQYTFFMARVSGLSINLTAPPWLAARAVWTSRDYAGTHEFGRAARTAGVEIIQYESVRSPGDTNLAVFTPDVLDEPRGGLDASQQGWTCSATADRVLMQSNRNSSEKFEWTR